MDESQLTFSDIGITKTKEYSLITEFVSDLTDSNRDRAGDNCPTITKTTISEQDSENINKDAFTVKLPPRTTHINLENNKDKYKFETVSFSRETVEEIFVFVVKVILFDSNISDPIPVYFIFPGENPNEIEDDDSEDIRTQYKQFDFKSFVDSL